jgi:hypothetical protein
MTVTLNPAQPAVATYPDDEIMKRLRWLYLERTLCKWCRHPRHLPKRRRLCYSCYQLALDFWKKPTRELGVAITFAVSEGGVNPLTHPIDGLTLEFLFERVAGAAFPWKHDVQNPFFHSANTWGENFSSAQRRLLYHEFSMVTREIERRGRRGMAFALLMDMEMKNEKDEIKRRLQRAKQAVEAVFLKK